ncbi:uncharacterized protein LOC134796861 [Cydia splendana]|uniref:uncharacterized protein LOC134796861 n=1 Tax=Cydia splendana TaxID=1100963 RepID=UPI00300BFF5F
MARFVTITPDMRDGVLKHLRESFFADEPLNKAVGLCQRGQPHAALERLCVATIADGLSVAAVDGDTVGLTKSFFADEPLNKAVRLCQRGQPHAALERLCVATIADGLSVAAVDGDTVLGVALNGIL